MKIHKILNNNVVCTKKENETEVVLMGRGLGFQKKVGDTIDESKIEKTFVIETKELSEKLARCNVIGVAYDTFSSPFCRDKHWPFS